LHKVSLNYEKRITFAIVIFLYALKQNRQMEIIIVEDIDLSSPQWLDIIFDKKNKKYGAYELRDDSSNRHLKAIIIVAALFLLTLFLPMLVATKQSNDGGYSAEDEVHTTLINLIDDLPPPEPIKKTGGSIPAGVSVIIGEKVKGGDVAGDLGGTPEAPLKKDLNNVGATNPSSPLISDAEKERLRKEAEDQARIKGLAANALGNKGANPGVQGNSTNGAPSGFAGDPRGSFGGKNVKGTPGNPFGNGDAIGGVVKPENTINCDKQVSLLLEVNAQGSVTKIVDVETAISEQSCIEAAKRAARKTTFPPDASQTVRYARIIYDYSVSRK